MDQVKKWNQILTTKLQPRLTALEKQLAQTEQAVQEYEDLSHLISTLMARTDPAGSIDAKVEHPKGSGVYVDAFVPDTSTIFIDLGEKQPTKLLLGSAETAVKARIQYFATQKKAVLQDLERLNKDIFVGMATVHQLQQLEKAKK